MPLQNFGNDVINAFMAGEQLKRQRELDELTREDVKFDRMLRKNQLQREEAEDKRRETQARLEEAQMQFDLLSGQPAQRTPQQPPSVTFPFSSGPVQVIPPTLEDQQRLAQEQMMAHLAQLSEEEFIREATRAQFEDRGFTLGPGQQRFDGGQQVAAVPPAEPQLIPGRDVPFGQGVFDQQLQLRTAATEAGATARQSARPPSQAELNNLGFYDRMLGALGNLSLLGEFENNLGIGGQLRLSGPNITQTPEGQRYLQAQREFTEARLRKESGAAIPESEFANDRRTYFVQPGDSIEVIEQKRRARLGVLRGLAQSSGKAFQDKYGDSDPSSLITGGQPLPPADGETREFQGATYRFDAGRDEWVRQ